MQPCCRISFLCLIHKLPQDIQWRMIGPLQSNKAKALIKGVSNLACIESVHSIKCADAIEKVIAGNFF
jgi:PLP dependent protein